MFYLLTCVIITVLTPTMSMKRMIASTVCTQSTHCFKHGEKTFHMAVCWMCILENVTFSQFEVAAVAGGNGAIETTGPTTD